MKRQYDLRHARRGAVKPAAPGKTRMLIHMDNDIVDWLRAQVHATGGGDYEETINQVLREYMARQPQPQQGRLPGESAEPASRSARRVALNKRSA
jgi:hypothetical protein